MLGEEGQQRLGFDNYTEFLWETNVLMLWVSILLFGLCVLGNGAGFSNQPWWPEGMRRVLWRSSLPCLLSQLALVPDFQGGKWNHSITGWMGLQGVLMVLFQLSPFYEHSTVHVEMGFMAGVVQRPALSLLVLLLL